MNYLIVLKKSEYTKILESIFVNGYGLLETITYGNAITNIQEEEVVTRKLKIINVEEW